MKRKTAALYNPYLDVLGGGERHILSIVKVLQQQGYDISIFWDHNLNHEIQSKLNIQFDPLPKFIKNIFTSTHAQSTFDKLQTLSQFDMFLYVTDGSYFFSTAKKNVAFCMVPQKSLYNMTVMNKLKTMNYDFIANSSYTQGWLTKWGINSQVIYPYISQEYIDTDIHSLQKEKIILSVGRFFKHLHSKRHDIAITLFKKLKAEYHEFHDHKLIIAGSMKQEDAEYVKELEEMRENDPAVVIQPNVSYKELVNLYQKSQYYWHMTGYGLHEEEHPEQVEHLGITPLEAMANGCITLCYNAGGPKEIINDGVNGYLFTTESELLQKMSVTAKNEDKRKEIVTNAKEFVQEKFTYNVFKERVSRILNI